MAKVYIQGQSIPVVVSEEDAREILELKNDPKYKGTVNINNTSIGKGKVIKIVFGETIKKKYDLSKQDDKEKILEFEKMLDSLKEQKPDREIEYYGIPLKDDRFPGLILNSILGGVHWTVVKYALGNHLIGRSGGGDGPVYWSILTPTKDFNSPGVHPDTSEFDDFEKKLEVLKELRSRREYAKKMSDSEIERISDRREEFIEKTQMPQDELKIEEVPF